MTAWPRRLTLLAALLASAALADEIRVRVEIDDGTHAEGMLVAIDDARVSLMSQGGAERSFLLDVVRRVVCAVDAGATGRTRLTLTDGTTLTGDDFSCAGTRGLLLTAAGPVEVPLVRVWSLEWAADDADKRPSWIEAVPEGTTSDLVVVGKAEGFEFVECAIAEVGAETVTVVLDEERIPVKRSKVIGLRWQRPDIRAMGRFVIEVGGGRLRADAVAWTPAGLVFDADDAERRMTLPAALLRGIDYAVGRTTQLATLPPESLKTEPFFGALANVDGLTGYFAPRMAPPEKAGTIPGLVIRPRTVATWRIPSGSRRFRTALHRDAETGPSVVTITIDGRQVFERSVAGPDPVPVEIDVTGGRRLGVTVGFGPTGGLAAAVRFLEPVIEQ